MAFKMNTFRDSANQLRISTLDVHFGVRLFADIFNEFAVKAVSMTVWGDKPVFAQGNMSSCHTRHVQEVHSGHQIYTEHAANYFMKELSCPAWSSFVSRSQREAVSIFS